MSALTGLLLISPALWAAETGIGFAKTLIQKLSLFHSEDRSCCGSGTSQAPNTRAPRPPPPNSDGSAQANHTAGCNNA